MEALCEVFPDATLFALVHAKGSVSPIIERMPIRTSFIQRLPGGVENYRHYLPLFPAAVRRLDMRGFDVVISSNHCVAKGVRTPASAFHVCYCYTPMRYIWGQYDDYFGRGRAGLLTRAAMRSIRGSLRRWDVRTAAQPHRFIAISENVRCRIRDIYHRDSDLIYPPVETSALSLSRSDDGYFLMVSALVPYKRVDLAVEAFNRIGDRLMIVGDGPESEKLRKMAGPNIELTGWLPDSAVRDLYGRCKAVIFPGEEDSALCRSKPSPAANLWWPLPGGAHSKRSWRLPLLRRVSCFMNRRSKHSSPRYAYARGIPSIPNRCGASHSASTAKSTKIG